MNEPELVKFTPAAVSFENLTQLKAQIQVFTDQHSNLVVTPETKKEVKKAKNEVGQFFKQLDDRRKAIKRQYEAPLKEFEAQFKDVTRPLTDLKASYVSDIAAIEEQEREERRKVAEADVVLISEQFDVDPAEVEFDDHWLNASMSQLERHRQINAAVKYAAQQVELRRERERRIKEHAAATHMDAAGWTQQVTADTNTDEVIAQMDAAKAEQHHEALVKGVDKETGEITTETHTLRITGAAGRVTKLADYLTTQGFEVTLLD
ncbi:DUF1351 domain-containing protein [Lacticaseibacillus hulanensis]|uniref:DUF1351 domain-containing protein n=1 Tax=Lacticaseibacillus hulanensis TaxID=2493111 RepID=UPI000FD98426|nr:DUF1351 domain-containing protein [Lacticaseibacillus hulanensis]